MEIRDAKENDIKAMLIIWKEYIFDAEPFFNQFVNKTALDESAISNYKSILLDHIEDKKKFCLVSIIDEHIAGYIYGEILENINSTFSEQIGYIVDLMIDTKFRRKGLGINLLESSKSWFSKNNISKISIQVRTENTVAIKFWEKQGFKERIKKMYFNLK